MITSARPLIGRLQEELGLSLRGPSPWRAALCTFVAFVVIGALPLSAFIWQSIFPGRWADPFAASAVLTGLAFFAVGALKSLFIEDHWSKAGLETLGIGALAALLAYVVGPALRGLV